MASAASRRAYNIVANAILGTRDRHRENFGASFIINDVVADIAEAFAADNPAFRRKKFYDACGCPSDFDPHDPNRR